MADILTLVISFSQFVIGLVADKVGDMIVNKIEGNKEELDNKFKNAVKSVIKRIKKDKKEDIGYINEFFSDKKNIEELIKLLFINENINLECLTNRFDTVFLNDDFIPQFINELKAELKKDKDFVDILSDKEIYNKIIENNDYLKDINENLGKIKDYIVDNFDFDKFYNDYKTCALNNLSDVNFLGLDVRSNIKKNQKRKVKDIFVKPYFEKYKYEEYRKNRTFSPINYYKLLNKDENLVILGKPGSGKSVLVKSLICDILENEQSDFGDKYIFEYIPFRIELREYLAKKSTSCKNIVEYLTFLLGNEYCIINLSENNIKHILETKKVIIFFDGYDEIFSIKDKISIKNDIENILNVYKNLQIVVTSRVEGYNENVKFSQKFSEVIIRDFNDNQIEEYVNKWYKHEENDKNQREKEIEIFLKEKNTINKELITNPLLLALIVLIYRNNLKIPESKLDIYKSCTKTLVDKWDTEKGLKFNLPSSIANKKESLFGDIAFWQYEILSLKKDKNITNEMVISMLSKKIIENHKITENFEEATNLATQFMDYAEKRSIYIENNFTHKTFLEYFTAYWIYACYEKKHKTKERDKLLEKYINNPFWFIVFELFFKFIDEDSYDTDIIDGLIETQLSNKSSYNFLVYVIPTLKNISNNTIKTVIKNSLIYVMQDIKFGSSIFYNFKTFISKEHIFSLYKEIYEEIFIEYIEKDEFLEKLIIFGLELELNKSDSKYIKDLISKNKNFSDKIDELSNKNINIFVYIRIKDDFNTYIDFINKFGVDNFFKEIQFLFSMDIFFDSFSIINNFFDYQLNNNNFHDFEKNLNILESHNLLKKDIIKFLINRGIHLDKENIINAIKLTNTINDKKILCILFLTLHNIYNNQFIISNDSLEKKYSTGLVLAISQSKHKDLIKKIINKQIKIEQIFQLLDLNIYDYK
ncbi:MAG: hypothetical protein A2086_08715 [Spirochaetes bacterium GWD1_27_9]|nr:MAG: hypothetical protein A2Z98_13075 [Spirochaetes bacterium GWB1_27_13]OHD25004.1 MAG: hypothetical protein A2Y34_13565 [Spirochaetes bacterium GWC1_27_15]OHD40482.1 MAG: hypothetical protein A2086_08715 [Spirochaetes bacterium GWD1_27_9]